MKILAFIKQVPASTNVEVDPKTGVLKRDGSSVKMNPYDLYALELSFLIKEMQENTIVQTISMGPPSAITTLKESLYMGADKAALCSDRAFAGADVLATSYTLSQAAKALGDFDLYICGKQTTDGDTAQVGPELAEFLQIPHIPYVTEILYVDETSISVRSTYDTHDEILSVDFPCLLTVDKGHLVPRLPSYKRKLAMSNQEITMISIDSFQDQNKKNYGLNGSPTQVEQIFPPDRFTKSVQLVGSPEKLSKDFINILKDNRYW
jgi:electron transfer flavoprotein beta subunit